jgi:hypothetical protein
MDNIPNVRSYTEDGYTMYVMDIENPAIHPDALPVLQRLLQRAEEDRPGAARQRETAC